MKPAPKTLVASLLVSAVASSLLATSALAEIGIISPAEAKALIEDADPANRPVVLDTRGGYKDYFRGHLPTAHHLHFDTLRGTDANGVPVQYLPDDLTSALLERAGVDKDRTHIIYATGDTLPNDEILSATMVAHVLEKFGVERILVLDGGLKGWVDAGLEPVIDYHGNASGTLPAERNPGIAIDIDELLAAKDGDDTVLIDARPHNEFIGDDEVWFRKGHIPGALNYHWAQVMEDANTHAFRPVEEVKAELEAAGIASDKKVIVYCGTSREGSLLRFYLTHLLGYPNVVLYEGSWKEYVWIRDQSLPVATGE